MKNMPRVTFSPVIITLILMSSFLFSPALATPSFANSSFDKKEQDVPSLESLLPRLQEIYETRASALLTGADASKIIPLYDQEGKLGRWALSHEQTKISYMQDWAEKRGVRIVEAKVNLDVKWAKLQKDLAELNIWQTLILGYLYPDQKGIINRFGVGTRHSVKLVKKHDLWLVHRDWYTDPLGDDTLVPKPVPADGRADLNKMIFSSTKSSHVSSPLYNRQGAVRYANKYAGLAVINGERKYNPRYRDLTGRGGDCTNFISQVLGDKEGGGLSMDSAWYYRYDPGGGCPSTAWVRTDSFARWLLYGGRAICLAKGTFPEVGLPSPKFPCGAIKELQKGDLLAYEEKHSIQHFAVIVGFDSKGYPLVNAHTADRYHCPWDIGWDRTSVFYLFHIKDS